MFTTLMLVEKLVENARKWVYATLYRGWFPDLKEHIYLGTKNTSVFTMTPAHPGLRKP